MGLQRTSSIQQQSSMTKEYVHVRKALMLLLLFAVGVSMIVNGCATLLQVID